MYVTMGTSLFDSASWLGTGEVLAKVRDYGEWLTQEAMSSPEARRASRSAARTRAALMEHLSVGNAGEWTAFVPGDLRNGTPRGPAMRYGAELATILKMYEEGAASRESFREFLTSLYERVEVLFEQDAGADGRPNPARVAGEHLVAYLNSAAGAIVARALPISGLSSGDPKRLIGGGMREGALEAMARRFRDLVEQAGREISHVDVVISGGYKLYGVALAHLTEIEYLRPKFRLIYIHEEGQLMTYAERHFQLHGERVPNPVPFPRFSDPGGPGGPTV
jgi:hypothetical protein